MKSYLNRAIIHIDGDAFFVSVEQAKDWRLKGKPVITGGERFIAAAMSYEAKERGVTRGMMIADIRKVCPDVVILPSDYVTYTIFARRMYNIVRRYTPIVEEYSIDECFADITGLDEKLGMSYEEIGKMIKEDLEKKLGITFGVGLASTKVLAKIASKHQKPAGYTVISNEEDVRNRFLVNMPIEKVWGIGSSTTRHLRNHGVMTAGQFAVLSQGSLSALSISKPYREICQELNGISVLPVASAQREKPKSIMCTRTFVPASGDPDVVFSHLSKNVEEACARLRHDEMSAKMCTFYIKSQDFRHYRLEYHFEKPLNDVIEIMSLIKREFAKLPKAHLVYRATGVSFYGLMPTADIAKMPHSLFDASTETVKVTSAQLFESIDVMNKKFGEHTVILGSSLKSIQFYKDKRAKRNDRGANIRDKILHNPKGRTWALPIVGSVRA